MECAHCEQVGATFVFHDDDVYCDIHCGKAHKRVQYGFILRDMNKLLKTSEFTNLHEMEQRVAAGLGKLSKQDMLVELQSKFAVNGFKVKNLDKAIALNASYFTNMDEGLKWFRLEKTIIKLKIVMHETIIARNKPVYLAFKARVLENWAELMDTSPNDGTKQDVANEMKAYYPLFEVYEKIFF